MGEIIGQKRRYYSGLDADKASIPAGGKAIGDQFFATDTKVLYFWDSVAWIIIPLDVIVAGMIKTDAVETLKIKNLNVTEGKIGPLAVTSGKIGLLAVDTPQLQALAVEEAKIGPLAVSAAKLKADAVETLKIKNLNVTTAKAALGFGRYVPVPKNAIDYAVGVLTTDATWKVNGLDFTADLPAGATGIVIRLEIKDDAVGSYFEIRHDAGSSQSKGSLIVQVANIDNSVLLVLPIESDRLMDYAGSNVAFITINITCIGYFI